MGNLCYVLVAVGWLEFMTTGNPLPCLIVLLLVGLIGRSLGKEPDEEEDENR